MAIEDQGEQIPFLAPATAPSNDEVTDRDEEDYTTLKEVQKILKRAIEDLKTDFDTLDAGDIQKLQAQVLGRQKAYEILVPVQSMVDSAIESIQSQRKGK